MRVLLIDNYDSFTYNLAHQIAEAVGHAPVVIRNDEPGWRPGYLNDFEAVVISPGPGTPEREADFGICRELIQTGELPTLGICLGHQGMAYWHGGRVERAPQPRHGRVSPVLHQETGLFDGVPSPFEVVRYHSLAVTELPAELEATAWTPDGVMMGLRHRCRPLWGVQFHPESVCGSHGHRLIRNFAVLARRHRAARTRSVRELQAGPAGPAGEVRVGRGHARGRRTGLGAGYGHGRGHGSEERRFEVVAQRLATRWDDETAFEHLFRGGPHAFWLDASRRDDARGRFSVMGDASGPLARVATADVQRHTVTVDSAHGRRAVDGAFLDWLDHDLRGMRVRTPRLPCDFALGWVGYLGYELKAQCGGDAAHRSAEPDAAMVFADRAVVFDHQRHETYLLALAPEGDRTAARTWLERTTRRLGALAGERPGPLPVPAPLGEVRLRHDRERYLGLIEEVQEEIAAGETYEVCLTNMAEADGDPDPWHAYRTLRRTGPAPFGALLAFDGLSVLSTSPERFLRISADGVAESRPIKGTRPRGATPAEDAALRTGLATEEKDRSENLMIVDLVRNDLGRCAEWGSVEASEIFQVETYETVHQLVSTVRAQLREDSSAVDCVRAAFPGGSMTGAPKIRTMRIIDRLEGGPRGVYSGAIGYFSLSGAADLSIVIRTAVLTPGKVRYGTGGAIVAMSDPEAEFEETAVKAAPLLALVRGEFPGRVGAAVREPVTG